MRILRSPLAAASLAVVLLAGCASGEAETTVSASSSAVPVLGEAEVAEQPAGVSGEVAYVADGVAQVQDGATQTAVSFDDETAITLQVELALSDLEVGSCVVVASADGVATSIAVSTPGEDGTCEVAPGGMGGGPGGDAPAGMEPPADGEVPADAPTAVPEGEDAPAGGFGDGEIVVGSVAATGDDELTVETAEGESTTVTVDDATTISGTEEAGVEAVEVGMCMTAMGDADDAGGYAATRIALSEAGEDGCVTAVAGRGDAPAGGERGAPRGEG